MMNSSVIMAIKDCIFESVIMGNDLRLTLNRLHFVDGFEKDDIIQAYKEMQEEANSEED